MGIDSYELIVFILCLIFVSVYYFYWYIRSVFFYMKNDWDFSLSYGPKIFRSDSTSNDELASPRLKFFVFLPFFAFFPGIVGILTLFSAVRGD